MEIQDLLKFSIGLNLAFHYLSVSINFGTVVNTVDVQTVLKIGWLDNLLMKMDRTSKNTHKLIWHKELWLID